ncbi:MAG TPA: copper homeostasis membrane protein CopD [Pseudolabrys sp.]|nr:copper homeostasis membrane protein CopD [Pseudolabrys sp.]
MTVDPLAFIRAAHFAATLLAAGTVCFMIFVSVPAKRTPPRLQRQLLALTWTGLSLTVLTGAAWLFLFVSELSGEAVSSSYFSNTWSVLVDTRFGWVWSARALLALLLAVLVFSSMLPILQIVAAAVLLVSPAFIGHAGATPGLPGDVHLASDITHLLAAGAWLGGLPAFVLLLWSARAADQPVRNFAMRSTRRFSHLAAASVNLLFASGIINSVNVLAGLRDLWATDYGRLISLKIGLFAGMTAIGAINRFYLTPQLPNRAALRNLARFSMAEIGLGICVLLAVGILGRLQPTAHVHASHSEPPDEAAFVHIHDVEAMADVTFEPGRTGHVAVTIRVLREDFSPFPAKAVRLVLRPPAGGEAFDRPALEGEQGTWTIDHVELSTGGVWAIQVVVTPQSGKSIVLDGPIVIDR